MELYRLCVKLPRQHALSDRHALLAEAGVRWGREGKTVPHLSFINQPANCHQDGATPPCSPLGSLSFPIALLLPNKLGFYHIANPDSETTFQEDSVFFSHLDFFFFFLDREHKQIYTTGVFCCCSCLNVVKSVSQK